MRNSVLKSTFENILKIDEVENKTEIILQSLYENEFLKNKELCR